jgi:peptide/nickel transport system substrate-binding protein
MDGDNKPLDIRIRQAMNYGFDRQNLVTICEIIWVPAVNGMIPMGLPSFNNAKAMITTSKPKN